MLPELAVSYSIGLIPSSAIGVVHYVRTRNKLHSRSYEVLQNNLGKIGLQWSVLESEIYPQDLDRRSLERQKLLKSILFMTLGFTIMSWPGFLFHTIIFLSPAKRLEQKIMASKLAVEDLNAASVQEIVTDIKSLI